MSDGEYDAEGLCRIKELEKDMKEATRVIGGVLKMQMMYGLIDIDTGSELDEAMRLHCKKYPNK